MEKLKVYFESKGFAGEDLDKILRRFTLKVFNRNELFAEYGKPGTQLGFVESGMFQYYIPDQGEESTAYVAGENTFIASLPGFFSAIPAQENIRALVSGRVWLISKTAIAALIQEIPAFKDFYIAILEWHICAIENSRNDLLRLSAEQRYEKMLLEAPLLLERIPLQYLASMLGITPRHLSRIRKK